MSIHFVILFLMVHVHIFSTFHIIFRIIIHRYKKDKEKTNKKNEIIMKCVLLN